MVRFSNFCGGGVDYTLPDGQKVSRALTSKERRDPKNELPDDAKLWTMRAMVSQGTSKGERGQPYVYNGVQYGPSGLERNSWMIDKDGLDHLAKSGRLWTNVKEGVRQASANQLRFKFYREESPGRRINNHWYNQIAASDKRYVVQTGDLAIQRCILMTSNPGDLILDPTNGGGTTALVAENWGRRWIAIDSSRKSVAVTRERVLVSNYRSHLLVGSEDGFIEENHRRAKAGQPRLESKPTGGEFDPSTGFVYDRMPYVSVGTKAYEKREDKDPMRDVTLIVDRTAGSKSGRVCSRFTVESEHFEKYQNPSEFVGLQQQKRNASWQDRIVRALEDTGFTGESGRCWILEGVEALLDDEGVGRRVGALSHRATLVERDSGERVPSAISIWPEDAKVDIAAIQRNVREVMQRAKGEVLVVVGAEFDDGTEPGSKGHRWQVQVSRVVAGTDLHLTGVSDKAGASSLTLLAEPAVCFEYDKNDELLCTLLGWNEFNPITGEVRTQGQEHVQMWMLDTDYDETQFCARRIHLPQKLRSKENRRTLEQLLGREGSTEALNAAFGWTSAPFPYPDGATVAVRVITSQGGTMSWSGDPKSALKA